MNRRNFSKNLAGAAALAAIASKSAFPAEDNAPPFQLSVMLWTVFRNLPFEQRLEKCIEAGYKNVELVGEYNKWSEDEFKRNVAKAKELGHAPDAKIVEYGPPFSFGRFLRMLTKSGDTKIELSLPGQFTPQLQSGRAYFLPSFYAP